MKILNFSNYILIIFFIFFHDIANTANVPERLNYQGILANSIGQPVTGQQLITFSLYNELSGGTAFWTETQNVPLDSNGRFSVVLGSSTPLDTDQFTGTTFIEIKVGADPALEPRQQLTSVAYALKSADAMPSGVIVMWSGTTDTIPSGWALCDGNNGTPNLRDRFVVGAGNTYSVGGTGGEATHTLTVAEMPVHNHFGLTGGQSADHSHGGVLISKNADGTSGSRAREGSNDGDNGGIVYSTNGTSNDHIHGITEQGGGKQHENRPPYYALAFIMKL